MISQAGWWTRTPSATPHQPIKWNASFWITFTSDDQLGWSMDSNPIHHPSPANKMKCYFLDYVQLLMISWAGWWTQTPSASPLQPKIWNATFWITFNFWWLAGLVNGLKAHPPPLSSQRNEMLILYYVQLLMISQACRWTWTPSTTCLQPKNEMLIFWLCSTSEDWPGWSMDSNPIHHPSPAKKMKCSFFITFNIWCWPDWSMASNPIHHPSPANKNEMLIFGLRWTSDDWPGWLMDSNPICHPSPAKKMKCLFLDYIQLLMIGRAGWWTQTSSSTPLLPTKWNAHFWIMFTSDDRLG